MNWSTLTIFAIPKSMTSGMPYMNWNLTLQLGWNCGCYLECHFDLSDLRTLSLSNFSKSLPSLLGWENKRWCVVHHAKQSQASVARLLQLQGKNRTPRLRHTSAAKEYACTTKHLSIRCPSPRLKPVKARMQFGCKQYFDEHPSGHTDKQHASFSN